MMSKSDSVATYFMKVSQLRDQLQAIGDNVDDVELVTITLNGLPSSWESFVQSICGREKLPQFDRLWTDCIQEEARVLSKKSLQKPQDEGTQALTAHTRRKKVRTNFGKKNTSEESTPVQRWEKKDLSKIRCFNCNTFGHYVTQCPQKKRKGRQHATTTDVDENSPHKKTKESKLDELADELRK
jgi:hypothetical protein